MLTGTEMRSLRKTKVWIFSAWTEQLAICCTNSCCYAYLNKFEGVAKVSEGQTASGGALCPPPPSLWMKVSIMYVKIRLPVCIILFSLSLKLEQSDLKFAAASYEFAFQIGMSLKLIDPASRERTLKVINNRNSTVRTIFTTHRSFHRSKKHRNSTTSYVWNLSLYAVFSKVKGLGQNIFRIDLRK